MKKNDKVLVKNNVYVADFLRGKVATVISYENINCVYVKVNGKVYKVYEEDLIELSTFITVYKSGREHTYKGFIINENESDYITQEYGKGKYRNRMTFDKQTYNSVIGNNVIKGYR